MKILERIGLWGLLIALLVVTALNYGALQGLEESVGANSAALDRPALSAEVIPGVPGELRDAWRSAKNNAQEAGLGDQLWLTLRLTNRGLGEAEQVVATLAVVDPIDGLYALAADGENFENAPYTPPSLSEGGPGETSATVEFDELAPGKSHLLFVGLRPRAYGPAPYGEADYTVWSDDYARHWNSLHVTATADSASRPATSFVEYGLGSAGVSVTTAEPGGSKSPG